MTKKTYSDVKAQIEALQVEADALRAQEVETVLADVKAKVAEYGLTEQDVFGKKRAGSAKAKTASAPRYRDPKTGATWSGKGRAPSWIVSARNRDRFLIAE
ncbi:H-NS histone family protein [Burkholderia aenigmatica]|uniref:H-NS histone family protein n=1 Tax=Burkholderia aenigmatica TaxID=2015348 RepID=UPI002655A245|nr:H-NS histone family protein [Burkholderia aenigmatica]MDN7880053.1 H-NS histone family protein [Burkholderia aenigmatica]